MKISVVTPVYKTEERLPLCIESVLAQTCGDWELLLADDGSPDRCPGICDRYAAADGRIRVFHLPHGGVVRARNRGAAEAAGDYVCFLDSDDTLYPEAVRKLSRAVLSCREKGQGDPDVILFGHERDFGDRKEEVQNRLEPGFYPRSRMEKEILPFYISDRRGGCRWWTPAVPAGLWGKAYRREYLLRHLLTEESIPLGEDAAMNFECLLSAGSVLVLDDVLYCYDRSDQASVTRAYRPDLVDIFSRSFAWLAANVGGREPAVDRQLNDYFAYRLLRAAVIEAEYGRPVLESAAHLDREFQRTGLLRYVRMEGLPPEAKAFLLMLKLRLFVPLLAALKVLLCRKKKGARN